jgi:hypothetical protein
MYVVDTGQYDTLRMVAGIVVGLVLIGVCVRALLTTDWKPAVGDRGTWITLAWLGVPIAVLFGGSVVVMNLTVPKWYMIPALGFYLLLALGLDRVRNPVLRNGALALLLVAFAVTSGVWVAERQRPDWEAGVAYIDRNAESGDLVLSGNPNPGPEVTYYSNRTDYEHRGVRFTPTREHVCDLIDGHQRVWVIGYSDRAAFAVSVLDNRSTLQTRDRFTGLDVWLFAKNDSNNFAC